MGQSVASAWAVSPELGRERQGALVASFSVQGAITKVLVPYVITSYFLRIEMKELCIRDKSLC